MIFTTIFFGLIIILISIIIFWVRQRYSFFEKNKFLHDKPTFPFGNLKGIGREFHPVQIVQRFYNKFKDKAPAFGLYFFLSHNVLITDLDVIKDILIKNFDTFHNRGLYYNKKDDPLTAHLLTLEDNDWRNMRSRLTPTFTSGKMKLMFDTVVKVSERMIQQLTTQIDLKSFEVKEMLSNFTTDVIGNVAFGLDIDAIENPDSEFRKVGQKFFGRGSNILIRMFFLTSFKDLAQKLGFKLIPPEISKFFMGIVKQTIDYRIQNNIERNDMMDLLLKVRSDINGDEIKLTTDELAAQCFVFFIAGFETSSSTATFVLFNLARHQDVQEKLREEIKSVMEKYENKITYEGMSEMKYLQMVIDGELTISCSDNL